MYHSFVKDGSRPFDAKILIARITREYNRNPDARNIATDVVHRSAAFVNPTAIRGKVDFTPTGGAYSGFMIVDNNPQVVQRQEPFVYVKSDDVWIAR